ncbi:MAG TPA: response regulator transcription factor [Anaerolineae bacterium]|nr:response regulator transcription factor [Anaerolineae bacterium]
MHRIRILIADDHAIVRHGLRLVLNQVRDFEVVGEAINGKDAYNMVFDSVPHIALLDWKMPVMDGFEAARLIRRDMASTKTLILSGAALEAQLFERLEAVDGFIHKDCDSKNLIHAIRAVASGQAYLGPMITQALMQRSAIRPKPTSLPKLSSRELQVLKLMATPLTYREIANKLIITENTVHTYVKRILTKLEQPNRTQAVLSAMRLGFID